MQQARELLSLLDEHGGDLVTVTERFDAWCEVHMRPWVLDHVRMDDAMRRRWAGEDVDVSRRLPSDLILAAARMDEQIAAAIGPWSPWWLGRPASTGSNRGHARCTPPAGAPHLTRVPAGTSSWHSSTRPRWRFADAGDGIP